MPRLPPLPVRDPSPPTQLPFRLRTLGRVRGQRYHVTAGTYHDDAMLTVVRAGAGHYHRGGGVQRVTRGFVGLVLPSPDPGLLMAEESDPYDHYFCRFAGHEALRMARAAVSARAGQRFFPYRRWPEAAAILDAMLELERQGPAAHPDWMSQTEGELARLLSLLLSLPAHEEPRLSEAGLRRYLVEHVARPFDLDAMARHFDVSRSHLSRRAHELLGETLGSASRRLKLDFSLSLLDTTSLELDIAEIALRVGYDDPLYFSKVFRRHVGVSPSRYRAELRRKR